MILVMTQMVIFKEMAVNIYFKFQRTHNLNIFIKLFITLLSLKKCFSVKFSVNHLTPRYFFKWQTKQNGYFSEVILK